MFTKKSFELREREETATPDNIKFIEPPFKRIGDYRERMVSKSISLLKLIFIVTLLILSVRVIFMEDGYLDLRAKNSIIDQLKLDKKTINSENLTLSEEIEKIKINSAYQKNLARDHLGVIAKDEILVIFKD